MNPAQENFRSATPLFTSRTAYLRHCIRISLSRRWGLAVLALILGACLGLTLNLTTPQVAVLAVFLGLLTILAITLNSVYRHAKDRFNW